MLPTPNSSACCQDLLKLLSARVHNGSMGWHLKEPIILSYKYLTISCIAHYSFLQIFLLYYLDSVLWAWQCVSPTVFTSDSRVSLSRVCCSRATLRVCRSRGTETPQVICMFVCMCWMRRKLLVPQKTPLHATSTRASRFEFKSMHTEASLVIVDSFVGCFEACVCVAAQTSHSSGLKAFCRGLSHCSKLLPRCLSTVSLLVWQAKAASRPVWEREVYPCGCVCVRERENKERCVRVHIMCWQPTDIWMHAHNHSGGRAAVPRKHIGHMSPCSRGTRVAQGRGGTCVNKWLEWSSSL